MGAKKGCVIWNKGLTGIDSKETRRKKSESKMGEKNPMFGKNFSKKTRERMGETHKGKHHSEETRKKISESCKGRKHTEEAKKKMSKNHNRETIRRGEKGPNWRGGITPENERIRKSIEVRLWHEAVFARDNWTCQECGQRGGKLQAHHIKPFAKFPELRFAIDNGLTLCKVCHSKTDTYGWAHYWKNEIAVKQLA